MNTKSLFVASAIIEAGAGLALIISPTVSIPLLIGVPFDMPATAVVVLCYSGLGLGLTGIGLWPAVLLHLGMAVWCLSSLGSGRAIAR